MQSTISLTYKINSTGPSTLPGGTPLITAQTDEHTYYYYIGNTWANYHRYGNLFKIAGGVSQRSGYELAECVDE